MNAAVQKKSTLIDMRCHIQQPKFETYEELNAATILQLKLEKKRLAVELGKQAKLYAECEDEVMMGKISAEITVIKSNIYKLQNWVNIKEREDMVAKNR